MYFTNEITSAVTEADKQWLRQTCLALQMLCIATIKEKAQNPALRMATINCHSIARLISLIFSDLKLVDGILYGVQLTFSENEIPQTALCTTLHSWLQTPDGAIIDPYPMGVIAASTAVLIPVTGTHFCVHGGNMYREDSSIRAKFNVRRSLKNAHACFRLLRKHTDEATVTQVAESLF